MDAISAKNILCKGFCDSLIVRDVPAGVAVGTPFTAGDGDRVGFYIVPDAGLYRIEDDGLSLPLLEGALGELLAEYDVQLDAESQTFFIPSVPLEKIASVAMRFTEFSLRVRSLLLRPQNR